MLCYAIPTSHFPAHAFSSSSSRPRHITPSSYHCGPSSYLADEEEQYYEYLDAVRRQRERRELEQVQAERWARQEAARVREQEARRAAYIEYQQYLEHQHQERLRAQAIAEARAQALAQAKAKVQAIAQARARAVAGIQAREHARAIEAQKQKQQQLQEQALRRQIMDHIIRSVVAAASTPDTPAPAIESRPAVSAPSAPKQAPRPTPTPQMTFTRYIHVAQSQSDEETAIRQRLQQVQAIQARLDNARKAFIEPDTLVFDASATSSSPKLAYSPLNRPVQVLEETLTKLLIDLDTITSDGHQQVKTARKQLAVAIEEELTKLESIKSAIWIKQNNPIQEAQAAAETIAEESQAEEAAPVYVAEENVAQEAVPVTHIQEAEEKESVALKGGKEVEAAAHPESHNEEETSTSITESEAPEATKALVPDVVSEEKEGEIVVDSPAAQDPQHPDSAPVDSTAAELTDTPQSAPTSATIDTPDSSQPSSSGANAENPQEAQHIEDVEQSISKSEDTAPSPQSQSHDVEKASSLSVTVTDDEEEQEAEAETQPYQDISKAFHAETDASTSQEDAGDKDKAAEDASSESSFEML